MLKNPRISLLLAAALFACRCSAPVEPEPVQPAIAESAALAPSGNASAPHDPPKVGSAAPAPIVKPAPPPVAPVAAGPPQSISGGIYRIGAGDRLEIAVYQHADLSGVFTVLPDGSVRYPLVGPIRISDLSVKEASEKIEAALEERYLVDAQVNLIVKDFLSKPVNVLGAVRTPGKYYLKAQTTLMDVLTEAGGLGATSGDEVVVTRRIRDPKGTLTYAKTFTLSLTELMKGQNQDLNVLLEEGDTVNVPERMLFYVSGEVMKPGSYRLDSGMTLLKAITAAGGLGKFATKRGVEIHRKVTGEEQVLKYNLARIEDQEEPDPAVLADDVVIVARRFF